MGNYFIPRRIGKILKSFIKNVRKWKLIAFRSVNWQKIFGKQFGIIL